MIERIKKAADILLDRYPARREASVYPSDTWVVSYPRSGNTWFRFLVANLLDTSSPASFVNIESRVPDVYRHPDANLRKLPHPRVLKSHEPYTPGYRRVIYLVRDPRDVCVSYYHYFIKIRVLDEGYPMDEFVGRFLCGDLDPFGPWDEHVGSWTGARGDDPYFLLLRYEDLLQHTNGKVRTAAEFLNLSLTDEQIARAVELSSAKQMSDMEKAQRQEWTTTKNSRPDRAFVRQAEKGNWRSELPPECADRIGREWASRMTMAGYATD